MSLNYFRSTVLALFVLIGVQSAHADSITYNFTGTVHQVDPSLSGTFNTSQTLSGSFTFETTTAGTLNGSNASGFSNYGNALTAWTMTVGGYTASAPFGTDIFSGLQVANNFFGNDRFVLSSRLTGTQFNGFNPLGFISLDDSSQAAFADTQLMNVGDLSGWTTLPNHSASWYLAFSASGNSPSISGVLTSISLTTGPASVPEPSTFTLLGIGLAMAWRARRKLIRENG